MSSSVPTLAGGVATLVFACATLPMLAKAVRSRDLTSYSTGNLVLANVGNAIYSVYVYQLPPGPIWFLHGYYLVSSGLMLFWSRRFAPVAGGCVNLPMTAPAMGRSPDATGRTRSVA
jgi:uncharacterized protein with PQ loop repeat